MSDCPFCAAGLVPTTKLCAKDQLTGNTVVFSERATEKMSEVLRIVTAPPSADMPVLEDIDQEMLIVYKTPSTTYQELRYE